MEQVSSLAPSYLNVRLVKPGDLVQKKRGDWDVGKIALVVNVKTNSVGVTITTVLVDSTVKPWPTKYLEVISESR